MLEALAPSVLTLAADAGSNPLTASGLWGIIQTFFRAVGGIIVVFLIWKAVSAWTKGQNGEMGRTIIIGLIVATLTFNLQLPIQLAQGMGNLVSGVVDLISSIVNSDGTSSGSSGGGSNTGSNAGSNTGSNTGDQPVVPCIPGGTVTVGCVPVD